MPLSGSAWRRPPGRPLADPFPKCRKPFPLEAFPESRSSLSYPDDISGTEGERTLRDR